jgi:hypothetical protein
VARIRTLKPEIIEDEKVSALTDTGFRLFTSMITLADDHGNVRADVRWLQAMIWWAHKEPPNVLSALIELTRNNLIDVYGVRGGTYAHLRGWEKHQRIDNAGKNRVPMPNDADAKRIPVEPGEVEVDSPKVSEEFREKPLDPDLRSPTTDMDSAAKKPLSKPRSGQISPDWSPRSEELGKAVEWGLDCAAEAEHFRDHHTARATKFTSWDSAFRSWLRNARKFAQSRGGTAQPSAQPRFIPEL